MVAPGTSPTEQQRLEHSEEATNLCCHKIMLCLRVSLKFKSLLPSNQTHDILEVD